MVVELLFELLFSKLLMWLFLMRRGGERRVP